MEEPIFSSAADCIRVGTKKLLAFHIISGGRRGGTAGDQETDWLMEEYRLIPKNGSIVTGYPYKRQVSYHNRESFDYVRVIWCSLRQMDVFATGDDSR